LAGWWKPLYNFPPVSALQDSRPQQTGGVEGGLGAFFCVPKLCSSKNLAADNNETNGVCRHTDTRHRRSARPSPQNLKIGDRIVCTESFDEKWMTIFSVNTTM